jgi:hypothetical protein
MYDWAWIIKVVEDFHRPRHAWRVLLRILRKNLNDVHVLFQKNQPGWEDYKFIIKNQKFLNLAAIDTGLSFVLLCKTTIHLYSSRHPEVKKTSDFKKKDCTGFFCALY